MVKLKRYHPLDDSLLLCLTGLVASFFNLTMWFLRYLTDEFIKYALVKYCGWALLNATILLIII